MIAFREGEQLIATYRRHQFMVLVEALPIALFFPVVLGAALFAIAELSGAYAPLAPLVLLGAALFLHLLWIALFIVLADFYLDVWILTSQRLIAVEQKGLFSRTISEFELARIQDVTVDVHGIVATLLNYGNLNVRTASEHEHFIFKQVWHPNAVKDEIARACKHHVSSL